MGPKPYKLLKNLIAPAKPKDKTYDQLTEKLKMHYNPKLITMTERAKFYMRNQKTDESVNDYVAELRRLAATCDFEGFLDQALRDRFVCGMNDKSTQTKLMAVSKLTFQKAEDEALASEAARKEMKELTQTSLNTGTAVGIDNVQAQQAKVSRYKGFSNSPAKLFKKHENKLNKNTRVRSHHMPKLVPVVRTRNVIVVMEITNLIPVDIKMSNVSTVRNKDIKASCCWKRQIYINDVW